MATTNLLQALGLQTFNNNLDLPPGSLLQANNVNIDRNGVIESRRGFKQWQAVGTDLAVYAKQLMTYKNRVLAHYDAKIAFDNGAGQFVDFSESISEVETGVRIKSIELNGNLYFTSSNGIKKISAKTAADLNTTQIINAGAIRALDVELNTSTSGAGFLSQNYQVGYRVVWGTKDNNGNLILGYPSPLNLISNLGSDDVSVNVKFYVPQEISSNINYFYQIYRTQPYPIEITPSDELKLVYEGFNNQTDNWVTDHYEVLDIYSETLRQANTNLYTNQYSGEGIAYGNLKPPTSKDITTYKNHVFYGNITTNQQLTNTLLGVGNFTFNNVSTITGTTTKTITTSSAHGLSNGDKIALRGTLFDGIYTITYVDSTNFTISTPSSPANTTILGGAVVYKTNISITKDTTTNYYWPVGRQQITSLEFNTDFSKQITKFAFNSATKTDYSDERIVIRSVNNKKVYGIWFDTTGSAIEPIFTNQVTDKIKIPLYAATLTSIDAIIQQTLDQFLLQAPDDFTLERTSGSPGYLTFTTSINGSATGAVVESGSNISLSLQTLGKGAEVYSNKKLTIYSAEDKVKYLVWFDATGEDTAPTDLTAAVVRIDLSSTDITTKEEICNTFVTQINEKIYDFICEPDIVPNENIAIIKTAGSGSCTDATLSITDLNFSLTQVQKGIGLNGISNPDANNKYFMLSTNLSSSIANEETTKSLLNAINKNSNDVVYGYYVSSATGLPGEFSLESRVNDNITFSLSSNNETVKNLTFNEILPQSSLSENLPNRLFFSKQSEPDSVPLVNYFDVGPRDKEIKRIIGLRDSLFIFKEEGIYRLFGNISSNFQVVLFDSSSNITATDSAVVLNNQIYVLTSQGVVRVSETGVNIISRPIENLFTKVMNIDYYQWISFGVAYEADRSYLLFTPSQTDDVTATQAFRFNTFTETWTTWEKNYNCGIVHPSENKLYFGAVEDNYIEVERKNLDRKDYADRIIAGKSIIAKITDTKIVLSNNVNLDIGDSIVQNQYLTISQINQVINKLQNDTLLNVNNDISILEAVPFDNLSIKLKEIVDVLNSKDLSLHTQGAALTVNGNPTISAPGHQFQNNDYVIVQTSNVPNIIANDVYKVANAVSGVSFQLKDLSNNLITPNATNTLTNIKEQYYTSQQNIFSVLQIEFNNIVNKLNLSAGAFYANYQTSEGITEYEANIEVASTLNNQITIDSTSAFIIGACENHKGINSSVIYAPQHFGDPTIWKHVREAKIMFESDNFEGAYLGFNTDIANDYEEVMFKMEGDGSWGNSAWGSFTWGGEGLQVPFRTLIPRQKQRCRFIRMKFRHANARNKFAIYGISYVYEGGTERTNK